MAVATRLIQLGDLELLLVSSAVCCPACYAPRAPLWAD